MTRRKLLVATALLFSCHGKTLPSGPPVPATYFTAELTDKRFQVAEHMRASIEMQISGEPFSQLLGRNLSGWNRFSRTTDQYLDPDTGQTYTDTLGYATAVESYEYSKQPMNNLSFESGAGVSLQFAPLLNPTNVTGDAAYQLLVDRVQHYADQSAAGGPMGKNLVVSPAPTANPLNVYGWSGFWPQFAEFASFDPAIVPAPGATRGCTFGGGYAAASMGAQVVGDYECGYNTLNLPVRDVQVDKTLTPDAMGYSAWKQGLWVINYWQTLHDLAGNPIVQVAPADLPQVGVPGNSVVGKFPDPTDPTGTTLLDGMQGVYLGDITLEGFQGLAMLDEMDNKSAFLLRSLLTSDGVQLGGFATTKAAWDYDYTSPLRWWPQGTSVTEVNPQPPLPGNSWKYFPQPTMLQITDGKSTLRGLGALAGGMAEFFALADFNNPDVGGQVSSRATFDGDPFAADNQMVDGEETAHDRALAVMKVALVDIDRLHYDPVNKVLVDESSVANNIVQLGTKVTTVEAAYSIVAMRTALRSSASTLTLYSNDTPDDHNLPTAFDSAKLMGAPAPLPTRVTQLIKAQADFIVQKLVTSDGQVANSYDLVSGAADSSPSTIEAEAAAIRGLLDAYLATSDDTYRQTATRIYQDLDKRFWMTDVRAFRSTAGVSDTLTYTPSSYGALTGALRQYWKLVANRPGSERDSAELLERWKRMFKLVINGWDDANADDQIKYPDECSGAGLQMAERALTGELSRPSDEGDRDKDCVLEISAAKLPSALAAEIRLTRKQQ